MIQWVYERAKLARSLTQIIVATDDERVSKAVKSFGGEAMMTSPDLQSGTDRVAAVAEKIVGDVYVNLQGDEPMMDPRAIDAAVELVTSKRFRMASAMAPLRDPRDLANLGIVKTMADRTGRAMFFTRLPVPYSRLAGPSSGDPFLCRRHLGLYVYDRETLLRIHRLPQTALERAESLEQLRAVEDGIAIGLAEVDFTSTEVNTPEELEKVRQALHGKKS